MTRRTVVPRFQGLSRLDVFEVVARGDARRLTERRVIEVDPRALYAAIVERDIYLRSRVQAPIGMIGAVALDSIEGVQYRVGVVQLVDLAPDAPLGRRHGGRVDAQIEERAPDGAPADEGEVLIER